MQNLGWDIMFCLGIYKSDLSLRNNNNKKKNSHFLNVIGQSDWQIKIKGLTLKYMSSQ